MFRSANVVIFLDCASIVLVFLLFLFAPAEDSNFGVCHSGKLTMKKILIRKGGRHRRFGSHLRWLLVLQLRFLSDCLYRVF